MKVAKPDANVSLATTVAEKPSTAEWLVPKAEWTQAHSSVLEGYSVAVVLGFIGFGPPVSH
ncbi:MAG: hypothetical protein CL949_19840 [Erythrobacter sp.]|nr:hypothetical protein [Erythrobacter sp.]